jgi:hypothetical protein
MDRLSQSLRGRWYLPVYGTIAGLGDAASGRRERHSMPEPIV